MTPQARRRLAHCHKLVAETAKGIMHQTYDAVMRDDRIWRLWQEQHPEMNRKELELEYVRTRWGLAIPAARATLAHMLSLPSVDPATKEAIMEALVLDNTLLRGRKAGDQTLMRAN